MLAAAAAVYFGLLSRFFVGYFPDDATYVLGARSLLQGRYAALYLPGTPPLIQYPPGYPFFLAPFVYLLQPHWEWLKLTSVAATLLSGALFWRLCGPWYSEKERGLVLALYALHPVTAVFSGALLSEPCFVLFSLLALLAVGGAAEERSPRQGWTLAALAAWVAVIRPDGVLFAASLLAGLAWGRSWRASMKAAGLTALALGGVALRNTWLVGSPTGYLVKWQALFSQFADRPALILESAYHVAQSLFRETLIPFDVSMLPGPASAPGIVLLGLCLFLLAAGVRGSLRDPAGAGPAVRAMAAFCLVYYGIHVLWTDTDYRHHLLVLPFLIAFLAKGIYCLSERRPGVARAALFLLLALYVFDDARLLQQTLSAERPAAGRLPVATLEWIRGNTPPEARFYASKAPTVYLYTGRLSHAGGPSRDREDFVRHLLLLDIGYALILAHTPAPETSLIQVNEAASRRRVEDWIASWPERFEEVYRNDGEATVVYRRRPSGPSGS